MRRLTLALAAVVVCNAVGGAHAVLIDFEGIASDLDAGSFVVGFSYTEDGFNIENYADDGVIADNATFAAGMTNTNVFGTPDTNLLSHGVLSANFAGSKDIGSSASGTLTSLTNLSGSPFRVASIKVTDFLASQASGNATTSDQVHFYGLKADGTVVQESFTFLTAAHDLETHTFGPAFDDLILFFWDQNNGTASEMDLARNAGLYQGPSTVHLVDEIEILLPVPVPEPSSILLLGLGALGLVRHTRGRRRRA